MDCVFCKIINNEIPSYTIYEDKTVKVILDINPDHNGHALIIPKKHFVNIEDIDEKTLIYISRVSKYIYKLLNSKLNFDGLTIIQNNGLPQEVKHYHMHIIPKYKEEIPKEVEEIYNIINGK